MVAVAAVRQMPAVPERAGIPAEVAISGGAGLFGRVEVAGAKNAATKMLVAALLADGVSVVHNVPRIGDVDQTLGLLASVGVETDRRDDGSVGVVGGRSSAVVSAVAGSTNRLPLLIAAALLHRHARVWVPAPGGCRIGARPTELWVQVLEALGCAVTDDGGSLRISRGRGRLVGSRIALAFPSVAATETALLAGVLARGRTTVGNAAREPEIVALGRMLSRMGARIGGLGTSRLTIDGVASLDPVEWEVPGDRLEAASYALLAAASDGEVTVGGCHAGPLEGFLRVFESSGGGVERCADGALRFFRRGPLSATTLTTGPYPQFSTDYQQPSAVLLTCAQGVSLIHETVYEQRLGFLDTLQAMGAAVQVGADCPQGRRCRFDGRYAHVAWIRGVDTLRSPAAPVRLPDLRGGMALVTAALAARGTTRFTGWEQVARGYQDLAGTLRRLGARLRTLRRGDEPDGDRAGELVSGGRVA